MQGLNRTINMVLNLIVSVLMVYGMSGIINDLSRYSCNQGPPVSFLYVVAAASPILKFLFVKLNTHDKYVPRVLVDVRHEGRIISREEKDGNV